MSVFGATNDCMRMYPAFVVLYCGMLETKQDRQHYYPVVKGLLDMHGITGTNLMGIVKDAWKVAKHRWTRSTEKGKKRKDKILRGLFFDRGTFLFQARFYQDLFPNMEKFVLLFQTKAPAVHLLFSHTANLAREFLTNYVKPAVFSELSSKRLKKLKVTEDDLLSTRMMRQSTDMKAALKLVPNEHPTSLLNEVIDFLTTVVQCSVLDILIY